MSSIRDQQFYIAIMICKRQTRHINLYVTTKPSSAGNALKSHIVRFCRIMLKIVLDKIDDGYKLVTAMPNY